MPKPKFDEPIPKSKEWIRRSIAHVWPEQGTVLVGKLKGKTFRAKVVAAPGKNKDDLGLQSLDNPKLEIAGTFNEAAQIFTQAEREKHGMKPIANAWKWWRRESDNKRLFDIPEYSKPEAKA